MLKNYFYFISNFSSTILAKKIVLVIEHEHGIAISLVAISFT